MRTTARGSTPGRLIDADLCGFLQDLAAVERLEGLLQDEKPKTAAAAQAAMRKLAGILKEQVRCPAAVMRLR